MLSAHKIESCYPGQYIPFHCHHNMSMDDNRMRNFKVAIEFVLRPGAKVPELDGGAGVMSWFAATRPQKGKRRAFK